MFLWPLWGKVTLLPRLVVVVQLFWLVVLIFVKCLELHGEVILFVVGCWLLCDHYVWSYWFLWNVLNFMRRCYSSLWAAGYCATVTFGRIGFSLRLAWTAVVSSFWSHACCFMRSVRLVAMVSLAVSYNAKDILLKERKKNFGTFLQFGDLFSVWCSVLL